MNNLRKQQEVNWSRFKKIGIAFPLLTLSQYAFSTPTTLPEVPTMINIQHTAVAGDSLTKAFGANCEANTSWLDLLCLLKADQPHHSWFDGESQRVNSIHDRFKSQDSSITAYRGAATTGAELTGIREDGEEPSFAAQAMMIVSQSLKPNHVEVLFGGNDLCSRDCIDPAHCDDPLYTEDEWRDALRNGLNTLVSHLPQGASILLGSVPRVQDIRQAGLAKQADNHRVNCESIWQTFNVCRIVTQSTPLNGESLTYRHQAIAEMQQRYNEILVEEARAYNENSNGLNPTGVEVIAEYVDEQTPSGGTFSFGGEHINGGDCFHPNLNTQNIIADFMWHANPH